MESKQIQIVQGIFRRGELKAFIKDKCLYVEDTKTHETGMVYDMNTAKPKTNVSPAVIEKKPERGSRVERLFGNRKEWNTKKVDADQGPYRGFLLICCEECGETKGFHAKRELYDFKCKCGHETALEKLVPAVMRCKCGTEHRYKTNLSGKIITHNCLACGAPVDMEINKTGTAYTPIWERR